MRFVRDKIISKINQITSLFFIFFSHKNLYIIIKMVKIRNEFGQYIGYNDFYFYILFPRPQKLIKYLMIILII